MCLGHLAFVSFESDVFSTVFNGDEFQVECTFIIVSVTLHIVLPRPSAALQFEFKPKWAITPTAAVALSYPSHRLQPRHTV